MKFWNINWSKFETGLLVRIQRRRLGTQGFTLSIKYARKWMSLKISIQVYMTGHFLISLLTVTKNICYLNFKKCLFERIMFNAESLMKMRKLEQ